jgi:hypothetical protein
VQVATTEQGRGGRLGTLGLLDPVDERRHLVGEPLVTVALPRLALGLRLERLDLLVGQEREDLEQLADLGVVHVQEPLVEGVRRHHLGVEPHRVALGLAVLGAVGLGDQRRHERVCLGTLRAPDQLDAGGDVAPLVGGAVLERDPVVAVEAQEVHRLEQHVAELRVADAGLQPSRNHIALQHPVHREVLADVAQEVDRGQARRPVVVVDDGRGVGPLEPDERLDLTAYPIAPVLHGVEGVQGAFRAVLGVADHAGGAADQDVRRVAGDLQAARGDQLHEVAHVQAGRGRVEADVEPHAPGREGLAQRARVRRVRDQTAPHEVVEEGRVDGAGHRRAFLLHGVCRRPACRMEPSALHRVGHPRARCVTRSPVGMTPTAFGNVGTATSHP